MSDITNHMMMSDMMSCNSLKFHQHNSQIGNPPVPYPEEGLAGESNRIVLMKANL